MRPGDQAEGLRRLFGQRVARVAAVIACRPRIGRTTLVTNLAVALARHGREVVVVDENRGMGNVADMLGMRPRYELAHALRGDRPLADALVAGPAGLTVLPASRGLRLLGSSARLNGAALAGLAHLLQSADVVLVDAAPGADADFSLPVAASRETIIAAAADTAAITETYARIKAVACREPEARVSIAVCRARQETAALLAIRNLSEVTASHLGLRLQSLGVLSHDALFAQAARAGKALPELFRRSPAAAQLDSIAARFEAAHHGVAPTRRRAALAASAAPAELPA
jgi:flagellar biosynthesis protein FlhG